MDSFVIYFRQLVSWNIVIFHKTSVRSYGWKMPSRKDIPTSMPVSSTVLQMASISLSLTYSCPKQWGHESHGERPKWVITMCSFNAALQFIPPWNLEHCTLLPFSPWVSVWKVVHVETEEQICLYIFPLRDAVFSFFVFYFIYFVVS